MKFLKRSKNSILSNCIELSAGACDGMNDAGVACVSPLKVITIIQRSAIVGALGLVNFITAVVYHFCPSLSAAFTKPGALTSADRCIIY